MLDRRARASSKARRTRPSSPAALVDDRAARCACPFIFKASYDKANRTSGRSFRGPGLDEGLRVLAAIKARYGVPILTDIHEPSQAAAAADVADVLQIPAFLCAADRPARRRREDRARRQHQEGPVPGARRRQARGREGRRRRQPARARDRARHQLRLPQPRRRHARVPDDAGARACRSCSTSPTACSCPAAATASPPAWREYIEPLASAGVAAGVDGVFLEVHEDPARAKSDAQNALRLDLLEPLLRRLMAHRRDRQAGRGATARMADRALARKVLETEAAAILALVDRLDERFDARRASCCAHCRGRVILTGMGKSGIICRKIAATLTQHRHAGVLPASGRSDPRRSRRHPGRRRRRRAVVQRRDRRAAAAARDDPPARREADRDHRRAARRRWRRRPTSRSTAASTEEACPMNLVPTASTTAALAIGDALAMTLLVEKGFRAGGLREPASGRQARQAADARRSADARRQATARSCAPTRGCAT